jgi:hypothetical protein
MEAKSSSDAPSTRAPGEPIAGTMGLSNEIGIFFPAPIEHRMRADDGNLIPLENTCTGVLCTVEALAGTYPSTRHVANTASSRILLLEPKTIASEHSQATALAHARGERKPSLSVLRRHTLCVRSIARVKGLFSH